MQSGLESYAEKLKSRGAVKDVDGAIQEVGGGFTADPTAQSVAFEKFLVCAVPDLDKKKDIQARAGEPGRHLQEGRGHLHDQGPHRLRLAGHRRRQGRQAVAGKTFKANSKKFVEEDNSRLLQAWEFCGKRSRKGKKVLDLEDFLTRRRATTWRRAASW